MADIELLSPPQGVKRALWRDFLARAGLAEEAVEQTVLLSEDGHVIATGSRQGNVLKCIAVEAGRQGEDLTAKVLTALRQEAFHAGLRHLFLYTKPENRALFSSLLFYPVAQTDHVLLMENQRDGIRRFLEALPAEPSSGPVGAAVMNCSPFTLGHRYLIETAAKDCGRLYVFVLSEESGPFPAADRLELVRRGTADLPNVTVLPTGPYLISHATFPTYFLQDREQAEELHCLLDIEIFLRCFVPKFSIVRRYVGTEPLSPLTKQYNDTLRAHLPTRGVEVVEVPRLERGGFPISASAVRAALKAGDWDRIRSLVPSATLAYLRSRKKEETP